MKNLDLSKEIKYSDIDIILFERVLWFKKYYYSLWYDNEDREEKYCVIWVLNNFVWEKYINAKFGWRIKTNSQYEDR